MAQRRSAAVLIVMGSESDLSVVRQAVETLDALAVAHEVHVASAHRSPGRAADLARQARDRGIKVIIAAAGGAAHLAGALAAHTTLPVIGVPIAGDSAALGGMDALLSTVQMPSGVPVATVAINGARNAALLAAEILATGDEALAEKLTCMREEMTAKVEAADERLKEERT